MNQYIEEKYQIINKKIYSAKNKKNNSVIKKKIRIAILGGSTTALIKESLSNYLNVNDNEAVFFESEYNRHLPLIRYLIPCNLVLFY